jgi:hypothetical protein
MLSATVLSKLAGTAHLTPRAHLQRRVEDMGAAARRLVPLLARRRARGQRAGGAVRLAALLQLLLLDMTELGGAAPGGAGRDEAEVEDRPVHTTLIEPVVTLVQLEEGAELHKVRFRTSPHLAAQHGLLHAC